MLSRAVVSAALVVRVGVELIVDVLLVWIVLFLVISGFHYFLEQLKLQLLLFLLLFLPEFFLLSKFLNS